MDESSDSHVIKFTNPKYGTKFLLLQRICGVIEEQNSKATCSVSSPSANFSRFSRNVDQAVTNKVCHPNDTHRTNCISLPQNLNIKNTDTNSKKSSQRNRKKKQMKEKRKRQAFSQVECYPPIPVPSREPYLPKPGPSRELNSPVQHPFIEPNLTKHIPANEPYKPEIIVKSQCITLLNEDVSVPSTNQRTFNDFDATGIITRKLLGHQPSPMNYTKNDLDNSDIGRINLSISEESHTRVLLTPLKQTSHANNTRLEPELIVLSSDSSNKSSMSELDSNNPSPSLLEDTSIPIDVAPSKSVMQNCLMASKNCKHCYSQKLATTFEASKTKNGDAFEVSNSKKRKLIPSTDLQPDEEGCVEEGHCQNEQDGQNYSSLLGLKSNNRPIESIDKGSRKCLNLIISVICSHFDCVSRVNCLKVLENNQYNILTTLLELQSLNSNQL